MLRSTPLSTLISRAQRWNTILKEEEQFIVYDLDAAIRNRTANFLLPWMLKKTNIKVFSGVDKYPVQDDYLSIGYIDSINGNFFERPRPYYTSLIEFIQDKDNKSKIAEIWDNGHVYYGIKNNLISVGSQTLNQAETVADWTASGTASSPTLDRVNYEEGNGSIRFTVTAGTATMKNTISNPLSDSEYKKKYHFKRIYLDAVPTSITLRLHIDSGNYLVQTGITTQFSGQAFQADAWNLVAMDLNTATETGTISSSPTFAYEEFDLVGSTAGTYYVDTSYLKTWELMECWYYSQYMIKTASGSVLSKAYFMDDNNQYSTDDELVCDDRFADCILYEGLLLTATNRENEKLQALFVKLADEAWQNVKERYPSIEPMMITHSYDFASQQGLVAKPYI